jgi:hypothetical protein
MEPLDVEWFRRQAQRFQALAPVITAHAALAEPLSADARRNIFRSFATNATREATWQVQRAGRRA